MLRVLKRTDLDPNSSFEYPKHMLKLMDKKFSQFYAQIFRLS